MSVMAVMKYLFPRPLPLWHAAAAVVTGHMPLLLIPRLLLPAESLLLFTGICLLFLIRTRLSFFIRIVAGTFLAVNIHIGNTLSLFSAELPDNIDIMIHDVMINSSDYYSVRGRIININNKMYDDTVFINIKIKGSFKPACSGEVWRIFRHVLRPVHGQLNEGQSNRQQYLLSERVLFSLTPGRSEKLSSDCNQRQKMIATYLPAMDNLPHNGLMAALLFGERRGITAEQRRLVQETGVAHVVAISGLHIGLAALWGWWAGRLLLLLLPLRMVAPVIPSVLSVCAAVAYVWLAGFAVPACRALSALLLWHLLRWRHYHLPAYQFVMISGALLLLADPLTILSAGFWLSYTAVTALLFWHHTGVFSRSNVFIPLTPFARLWRNIRSLLSYQCGLFLLLLPVQGFFFGGVNMLSFLSNLWVVPVISFLTVPLLFAGLLIGPALLLADFSLALALWPLPFLAQGWMVTGHIALIWIPLMWAVVYIIRLDMWRQHPLLLPGMVFSCCLYLRKTPLPEWSVTVLDIGHGLAAVVIKDGRAVVYDTGNRFGSRDDGLRTVLPYLRYHRLTPDWIMISHDHRDHTGGLGSLRSAYPAAVVKGNIPQADTPCRRGERWLWQSLYFEVLWPDEKYQMSKNDGSCVIRISDGKHQVLLTGDIEKQAEKQLIKYKDELSATVLQVPHHGSKTSSSEFFIRAVNPAFALVSVARYSPWRLPSDKVRRRYHDLGVQWHDTAHSGQISVSFFADEVSVATYRTHLSARWFSAWFGDQPVNG
ncbi:DNA internalization-related competence protein ComEC/Rec2 [Morganella morganii]|uniref:DNA internalization-related competence protein ComEC/Rec2 n=2 Tax=Morganella morganii TaxID=582 RepID=A0AAE4FAZ1_MORMO|nr:DNA internalization-related competence protein ComEC/Rec2 [Morganella morganii]MDS0897605.1 DNA internalization-related competence protein ComEC/Rec2 [Morganella morganii]